ncbi:MAG TPA: hypothetical protein VFU59_06490 [Candidatus Eisenbacteria bacterium]|nr:hypothetical protein [Candidatus Eisenbacteria bacterium]
MSLEAYAGTLTRYYTDDWERAAEPWARGEGVVVERIAPDTAAPPAAAADVSTAVRAWREALTIGLGDRLAEPIEWSEDHDLPYFTDQLDWPGYRSLVLWASYAHRPDLSRPTEIPEGWEQDPAFLASLPKESATPYRQVLQPSLWLPARFDFAFKASDVTGTETWIGSTDALHRQLGLLCDRTFRVPASELTASQANEPAGTDELERAARRASAALYALSRSACEHRLPLLLVY